jgi:hypothetical protein
MSTSSTSKYFSSNEEKEAYKAQKTKNKIRELLLLLSSGKEKEIKITAGYCDYTFYITYSSIGSTSCYKVQKIPAVLVIEEAEERRVITTTFPSSSLEEAVSYIFLTLRVNL